MQVACVVSLPHSATEPEEEERGVGGGERRGEPKRAIHGQGGDEARAPAHGIG